MTYESEMMIAVAIKNQIVAYREKWTRAKRLELEDSRIFWRDKYISMRKAYVQYMASL